MLAVFLPFVFRIPRGLKAGLRDKCLVCDGQTFASCTDEEASPFGRALISSKPVSGQLPYSRQSSRSDQDEQLGRPINEGTSQLQPQQL